MNFERTYKRANTKLFIIIGLLCTLMFIPLDFALGENEISLLEIVSQMRVHRARISAYKAYYVCKVKQVPNQFYSGPNASKERMSRGMILFDHASERYRMEVDNSYAWHRRLKE